MMTRTTSWVPDRVEIAVTTPSTRGRKTTIPSSWGSLIVLRLSLPMVKEVLADGMMGDRYWLGLFSTLRVFHKINGTPFGTVVTDLPGSRSQISPTTGSPNLPAYGVQSGSQMRVWEQVETLQQYEALRADPSRMNR